MHPRASSPNPREVYPLVIQQLTYHLSVCVRYLQFTASQCAAKQFCCTDFIMDSDWDIKLPLIRECFQLPIRSFYSSNVLDLFYLNATLMIKMINQGLIIFIPILLHTNYSVYVTFIQIKLLTASTRSMLLVDDLPK